jgi:hypothetical protein
MNAANATEDERFTERLEYIRDTASGLRDTYRALVEGRDPYSNGVNELAAAAALLDAHANDLAVAAQEAKYKLEEEQHRARERQRATAAKAKAKTKPARKPKLPPLRNDATIDRHIARAKTATAPRAKRASPVKEPCVRPGERHRFGTDGTCRNKDEAGNFCDVRRGERPGDVRPGEADAPTPPTMPAGQRASVTPAPSSPPVDGQLGSAREIAQLTRRRREREATEPAPSSPRPDPNPAAAAKPKPKRRNRIELPDGTTLNPDTPEAT